MGVRKNGTRNSLPRSRFLGIRHAFLQERVTNLWERLRGRLLGSLSNDVFERRTSTGSCPFSFLGDGFAQIFSQIVSIRVKKLSNTNYIASRHITREKSSLPVNVRCSKTSLLKLPIARPGGHARGEWTSSLACLPCALCSFLLPNACHAG